MTPKQFRTLFMVLHHMDLDTLESNGVITKGAKGGSDWIRFNSDLTTFVLKLPEDRVAKLAALVAAEMPTPERVEAA